MRGGFVHNSVLLAGLEATARERGATHMTREVPVRTGNGSGSIDLVVRVAGLAIAIEAETRADRGHQAIAKAESLGAAALLIVTPTRRVADLIRRSVRGSSVIAACPTSILPLGPAQQRLEDLISQFSARNLPGTQKERNERSA